MPAGSGKLKAGPPHAVLQCRMYLILEVAMTQARQLRMNTATASTGRTGSRHLMCWDTLGYPGSTQIQGTSRNFTCVFVFLSSNLESDIPSLWLNGQPSGASSRVGGVTCSSNVILLDLPTMWKIRRRLQNPSEDDHFVTMWGFYMSVLMAISLSHPPYFIVDEILLV